MPTLPKHSGRRRSLVGTLLLASILLASPGPSVGSPAAALAGTEAIEAGTSEADKAREKEYLVKAAFLNHFLKYTKWPVGSFEKEDSPIRLTVVGTDPFGETLDKTFKGKLVDGHPVVLTRLTEVPEELDAHLVFAAGLDEKQLQALFDLIGDDPVLLAGEQADFAIQGGHCNFVLEDGRVKFEINPKRAKECGLSISSELLKLARIVPVEERKKR